MPGGCGSGVKPHSSTQGLPPELMVRFETEPGRQMQVNWVKVRRSADPLFART
jgi:transposase